MVLAALHNDSTQLAAFCEKTSKTQIFPVIFGVEIFETASGTSGKVKNSMFSLVLYPGERSFNTSNIGSK